MKVQEGDRIRILVDRLASADVEAGDVLEVTGRVGEGVFLTESPRAPWAAGWWFSDYGEGKGWERAE